MPVLRSLTHQELSFTQKHTSVTDAMPSETSSVLGGDVRLRSGIQESSGPNYNKLLMHTGIHNRGELEARNGKTQGGR